MRAAMQPDNQSNLLRRALEHVRREPGSRSVAYFGTAALLAVGVARMQDRTAPYALVREHVVTLPFGAALTYACVCLRPEDRARWNRVPLYQGVVQALQGWAWGPAPFSPGWGSPRPKAGSRRQPGAGNTPP